MTLGLVQHSVAPGILNIITLTWLFNTHMVVSVCGDVHDTGVRFKDVLGAVAMVNVPAHHTPHSKQAKRSSEEGRDSICDALCRSMSGCHAYEYTDAAFTLSHFKGNLL